MTAVVPSPLDELGEVFVPIPPQKKGTQRNRNAENLLSPDDPVLEAYLEAGHNYGVACRGDLAVVDADEPKRLRELLDALPETAWQVSGSRESEHYFLAVPGLDEDIKLYPPDNPDTDDDIGHIKAAEQSYVVGPGSTHPSGNQYGPLHGDEIATLDEDELRDLIEPFRRGNASGNVSDSGEVRDDVDLSVDDVLATYPEGTRTDHPFHGSDTGANFMVDEGGETWRCWRHDCTGNALHLIGIEQGVIRCGDWKHGGLDTDTWREIFTAAREAGYDLSEYAPSDSDAESVVVLPNSPRARIASNEWDWRHAGERAARDEDPLETAREQTTEKIATAIGSGDRVLIEALPTLGKSYGAVKAAAETGEPVTILTTRGNKEQYSQLEEWCEEFGLSYERLPAFTRDCETARGDHGEEWKATVRDWYNRGATAKEIHALAETVHGSPLPCQEDGECDLATEWDDVEPDETDVLIGHYTHGYKPNVVKGRTVLVDEFPEGAYEQHLDHGIEGAISYFLQEHEPIPFDDYADLLEHRDDEQRRADALAFLDEYGLDSDARAVLADSAGHAAAPAAAFTILAAARNDLGNGWERAPFPNDDRVGLFNRETGIVSILTPPTLDFTTAVVALDGTPTPELWELVLGERRLNHIPVLTEGKRREYITDGLGLNIVPTTDAVKPYNTADHVAIERDTALLDAIADEHGQDPAVISSYTALEKYDTENALDLERNENGQLTGGVLEGPASAVKWYGNVLGSNRFANSRVGAVIGSNHYGDGYIKKWAAYADEAVERNDEKGPGLSYGPFGDKILRHMREHDTLQAVMRFGRDGNGATVYVHTDTLPEWVPVAGEGRVIQTWSDGMRQVLAAANDLGEWTTAELAAHPDVEIGERQVRDHLTTLVERGYIDREVEGCGFVWRDDGLHRVNDHGEVELAPVDLDDLSDDESAELARMTNNTWKFRTSGGDASKSGATGGADSTAHGQTALSGGDTPPGEAD